MKIIKKNSERSLIKEFISIFKKCLSEKTKSKKRLSFVLTGGSSPKNLYKELAKANIDWSNVDLFWGDERFISSKSKDSNYKMANDLLISKIKIKKKNLFKINTNILNISKCSLNYRNSLKRYFKNRIIRFDFFLLGMGKDGHIASIFPKTDFLKDQSITKTVSRKDFKRITLNLHIINKSKKIILWLNKKSKTLIFNNLSKNDNAPVKFLNRKKLTCLQIN